MLSRPNPVGRRLFWTSIHLLVRVTDWARNAARATLLVGVALVCSAVWFVSTSSAHVWTINGWDRLFGSREELQAIDASGMPLPQTHCGSSTTVNLLTFDEPSAPTSAAEGTIGSSINASGETPWCIRARQIISRASFKRPVGLLRVLMRPMPFPTHPRERHRKPSHSRTQRERLRPSETSPRVRVDLSRARRTSHEEPWFTSFPSV